MITCLVVALGVVDDGGPVLDVDLAHGVHPQRRVPPQLDVSQHAEVDGLEGAQLVEVGLRSARSLQVEEGTLVQGDHSGCSLGLVDIKIEVAF